MLAGALIVGNLDRIGKGILLLISQLELNVAVIDLRGLCQVGIRVALIRGFATFSILVELPSNVCDLVIEVINFTPVHIVVKVIPIAGGHELALSIRDAGLGFVAFSSFAFFALCQLLFHSTCREPLRHSFSALIDEFLSLLFIKFKLDIYLLARVAQVVQLKRVLVFVIAAAS